MGSVENGPESINGVPQKQVRWFGFERELASTV